MRPLCSAVLAAAFAGAQVQGASLIQYGLELGGDNHAGAGPQFFTPGTAADGQVYRVGDIITWDVLVEVSGVYQRPGHPADGHEVQGVANLVYDLELRRGSPGGDLAPEGVFFSSAQAGRSAAFALSYDAAGNGPGRMVDPISAGGPYLDVYSYPTNMGDGHLYGMGAGYSDWVTSGDGRKTAGVGMELLPNNSPGLGVVPITEGQIDTSNMQPGLYILSHCCPVISRITATG